MSFRENLKQELTYQDIQVKELAQRSGVNIRTINNYLSKNGSMPAADSALKIAKVLGVSIDYLINGNDSEKIELGLRLLPPETRNAIEAIENLPSEKKTVVYKTIKTLVSSLKDL